MNAERSLGSTGLAVSPIGLGLAALGRPGYLTLEHGDDLGDRREVADLRRRTHAVLDAAVAEGVSYIDAARSYGLAERFLGEWLRARGTSEPALTVGSKWGYTYTAGWQIDADEHEVKVHTLDQLDRQLGESRAELGDALRLYQVHSATLDSGVLDDPGVLARLATLTDEGLVVGLSTSGPEQARTIRRALAVRVDGRNPFRCVQATWNPLEPSAGPALAEAHEAGWGVICKEVLANGRLTDRGDLGGDHPLRRASLEVGVGLDAVAMALALAQPFTDVALSGAVTIEQLRSNMRAVRLPPEIVADVPDVREPAARYWARRSDLRWT